ncbi:hypothetical protein [Streptomyces sp. NPDC051636]|uniref:hypothetical protein n=1 Tax=Streptomyces sp. NPDC051636 TaxID=3365663 RepID=UPI003788F5DF
MGKTRVDLELPDDPRLIDVDLVEVERRDPLPPDSGARCALGVPIVRDLGSEDGVIVLAVAIPCSFDATDEPIVRASVTAGLASVDGSDDHPLAYGLQPAAQGHPAKRRAVSFSFELSLTPALTVDVAPSADGPVAEPYVRAYGEGSREPEWRFRRTSTANIDGIEWLAMLVVASATSGAELSLALAASVRRRTMKVIPYTARLPSQLSRIRLAG